MLPAHSEMAYSEVTALNFLNFSKAAYCFDHKGNNSTEWDCEPCKKACPDCTSNFFMNASEEAAGYVASSDDHIVVAFRGSDNIKNWISDFTFFQMPSDYCHGCTIHSGFHETWTSLRDEIMQTVKSKHDLHPHASIHLTGHSLGAAVAVLAALDISLQLGLDIVSLYTFGLPRVGNFAFKDFFNVIIPNSIRVTHNKDPVPRLPPKSLGFWHTGLEVFYDEPATSYKVCDGSGEDPTCSDAYYEDYIGDHLKYIRASTACD